MAIGKTTPSSARRPSPSLPSAEPPLDEPSFSFAYNAMEDMLCQLFGVSAESVERGLLRSRIKHLRKTGIPLGRRPGKGSRQAYTLFEFFQVYFSLELSEFGLGPLEIKLFIEMEKFCDVYAEFRSALARAISFGPNSLSDRKYLSFNPSLMTQKWLYENQQFKMFAVGSIADIAIDVEFRQTRRFSTINLSLLAEDFCECLNERLESNLDGDDPEA